MARIEVRVNQDTKGEWEKYVEERPGIPSLSALVRMGVTEYIVEESGEYEVEEMLIEQNSDLIEAVETVERQVGKTRADIIEEDEIVGLLNSALSAYFAPIYEDSGEFRTAGELVSEVDDE